MLNWTNRIIGCKTYFWIIINGRDLALTVHFNDRFIVIVLINYVVKANGVLGDSHASGLLGFAVKEVDLRVEPI
jgi:hypothetical protein